MLKSTFTERLLRFNNFTCPNLASQQQPAVLQSWSSDSKQSINFSWWLFPLPKKTISDEIFGIVIVSLFSTMNRWFFKPMMRIIHEIVLWKIIKFKCQPFVISCCCHLRSPSLHRRHLSISDKIVFSSLTQRNCKIENYISAYRSRPSSVCTRRQQSVSPKNSSGSQREREMR